MATRAHTGDAPAIGLRVELTSRRPADGTILGSVPVMSTAEVDAAVARARTASGRWGALTHRERRSALVSWRRSVAQRCDALTALIHDENGKSRLDALIEVYLALTYLDHASARARRALRRRRVSSGLLLNYRASVDYQPLGVVAVIGPWNYPLSTPMGSIAFALAAGNTVVFKPSELTPLVGVALAETAAATLGDDVLQVVTGDGATGAALAAAAVDKIAFTGSTSTGRRVLAAAAPRLTPVVLELGGKDPFIVAADADVDDAASAAVFGAMTNSGQACIAVERAYVDRALYPRFVDAVVREVAKLRTGDDLDLGAITRAEQVELIRAHLQDARDRGATILVGGPDAIVGRFVPPTVVTDLTPAMRMMREETFGPVLPIIAVDGVDEAIRLANDSPFGLGSTLFAGNGRRALAARLRAGMTSINGVVAYAGIPTLPFGGVGDSGFGRIHGDEGLREFSRVHAVAERRFRTRLDLLTFDVPRDTALWLRRAIAGLYGGGLADRVVSIVRRISG